MNFKLRQPVIRKYLSLVKFAHTVFALPFACIGFVMGVKTAGCFRWPDLLFMLLCMVCARNAAMGFNRYADRRYDARNPRTAERELPGGVLSPAKVLVFIVVNAGLFILSAYCLNPLCFYLSPIALLVVLGYSLTKRFTRWSHLVLGLGLSIAPVGAYIAVTGAFAAAPLYFSALVIFWTAGFDILYALSDEYFDKQERLHSIPQAFGRRMAMRISAVLHFIAASLVVSTGVCLGMGRLYWMGGVLFIALLLYQHLIIKPNDLSRLNAAFFITNGIASIVFAVFTMAALLLQ
jgi:4-hydroxybenzoate polyprenyltransferase